MTFINGVMLDPSRLLERREVYEQLIPLIADYGYFFVSGLCPGPRALCRELFYCVKFWPDRPDCSLGLRIETKDIMS